ncbi:MAG: hypothetical protein H6834_09325 [Planctomycetes bacterium]|nr:hypothetical protein [Planctomycetota bacterium]
MSIGNRLMLAAVIGGGVLTFFGIQEMRLSSAAKAEPQAITLAELAANGPGDNAHVEVKDFIFAINLYVYEEKSKGGAWKRAWIPALPLGGPWHQEVVKLPEGADLPKPSTFSVIVSTDAAKNEAELMALGDKETLQGMIINKIESLGKDEKKILADSYPTVDLDKCWILEVGRKPASSGKTFAMIGGGLVLVLGGLVLLLKGRR